MESSDKPETPEVSKPEVVAAPPKRTKVRGRKPKKVDMLPTPGLIKRKRGRPAKNEVYAQRQAVRENLLKQEESQGEDEEEKQQMDGSGYNSNMDEGSFNNEMDQRDSMGEDHESYGGEDNLMTEVRTALSIFRTIKESRLTTRSSLLTRSTSNMCTRQ